MDVINIRFTILIKGWHSRIGSEGTLADAILDRIAHDSYEIFIAGEESMRRRKGINLKKH